MNRSLKVMYSILGLAFLCIISPALANTTCDGLDMFGMKCCIEKGIDTPKDLQIHSNILYYTQSGAIYQRTETGDAEMNSGSQNYWYFQMLFERRSFTSINYLEDVYLSGTKYKVTFGQKCNHPEIRINGKEYRNNMGIFDVKSDNQYLRLYYYENNLLSAIRCAEKTAHQPILPISETSDTVIPIENSIPETVTPVIPQTSGATTAGTIIRDGQTIKINPIILENVKTYRQLNQSTLYELVKEWGMDRKTDRKSLAEQAGIDPATYKGTKTQNLIIRAYLLKKISINIQATSTQDISLPAERLQAVQKIGLRRIVGLRGYTWKTDRVNIAKEFGYEPQIYFGTRVQNIKIRSWLLKKIHKQQ